MNKDYWFVRDEKEYWMDVQLRTTECDECGTDMDVKKSIPVRTKNKGYPIEDGYFFVCSSCFKNFKKD
jgi:hypothetical protein|tara:strand:+ start:468 stop:671 length:204 start_codon:yes stop_codon:yes gene_type:complete